MHTQEKDDKVQFAVTLTPATTKAEKYKATSGGATERIRRDISYPKLRVVGLRGRVVERRMALICIALKD
jgi:hypothetical protein